MNTRETKSLSEIVQEKPFLWVIHIYGHQYYQVKSVTNFVTLTERGKEIIYSLDYFNSSFRIASSKEFKRHVEFLTEHDFPFIKNNH